MTDQITPCGSVSANCKTAFSVFFSLCAFEKTYVHSLLKKEKINFNRPPNQNENH